jgi:hypothetical protein
LAGAGNTNAIPRTPPSGAASSIMSNGVNPKASSAYRASRVRRAIADSPGELSHGGRPVVTGSSPTRTVIGNIDP